MVTSKSLFNASAKQCAVELVERRFGVTLDLTQVDIVLTPTHDMVDVTITQKSTITSGRRYVGTGSYRYHKLSVLKHLPANIVYTDRYPVSFESISSNLLANYGLLLEERDFALVKGATLQTLEYGVLLNATPDADNRIWLETLTTSGRWIAGERIPLHVYYQEVYETALAIRGDAPDAVNTSDYSYQYQITGGVPPYNATIVSGELPFALDPTTAVLTGTAPPTGSFTWTVGVLDSDGGYAEIIDTLDVLPGSMSFTNLSTLDVDVGNSIDFFFTTAGGQAPKRYELINPVGGLSVSLQGRLVGYLTPGSYTVAVRCTDATETSVETTLFVEVLGRSVDIVRQSLREKLNGGHWYQFFTGRSDLGNYKIPDLMNGNDLLWSNGGQAVGTVKDAVGGDLVGTLFISETVFVSEEIFLPLNEDFTIYLRFRGAVDQPNRFIMGTSDGLNGWALSIDDTGTGIEFSARQAQGQLVVTSDEGVSETLPADLVITKLGRHIWIKANGRLKHYTLDSDIRIVENAAPRLAVGRRANNTGLPYEGYMEVAAVLRAGLLPDEIDMLTNNQAGQQYADLRTAVGLIPLQPFFFQEFTINIPEDSTDVNTTLTINSGEAPFSSLRFLDHTLNATSTAQMDPSDPRLLRLQLQLYTRKDTIVYLAMTDATGRVARVRLHLMAI